MKYIFHTCFEINQPLLITFCIQGDQCKDASFCGNLFKRQQELSTDCPHVPWHPVIQYSGQWLLMQLVLFSCLKPHIVYNCLTEMCYAEHRQATTVTIRTWKVRDILRPIYHYPVKTCIILLSNQHTASPGKYLKHYTSSVWLRISNNRLEILERNQAFQGGGLRRHCAFFSCCISKITGRVQVGSHTFLALNWKGHHLEKNTFQQLDTVFQDIN